MTLLTNVGNFQLLTNLRLSEDDLLPKKMTDAINKYASDHVAIPNNPNPGDLDGLLKKIDEAELEEAIYASTTANGKVGIGSGIRTSLNLKKRTIQLFSF